MKTDGWISLHRKILESKIWEKPAAWRVIWIFLLLEVNHETGEKYFDYKYIAKKCKERPEKTIEEITELLKKDIINMWGGNACRPPQRRISEMNKQNELKERPEKRSSSC